jgi:hypothetical protein
MLRLGRLQEHLEWVLGTGCPQDVLGLQVPATIEEAGRLPPLVAADGCRPFGDFPGIGLAFHAQNRVGGAWGSMPVVQEKMNKED